MTPSIIASFGAQDHTHTLMNSAMTDIAKNGEDELIDRIEAWLPQTQCTRCGYPRCRLYAEAVARGEADINQCPPGGDTTLNALAAVLDVAVKPLNPVFGEHQPRQRAVIDEQRCIGCRKCIDVCPVDAILGAPKLMHTVISPDCSGCELCLPPCPVDCIHLVTVDNINNEPWPEYARTDTEHWRRLTELRLARLSRQKREQAEARQQRKTAADAQATALRRKRIKKEIKASVTRVKTRRAGKRDSRH